jgi:hypothetical protein
VIPAAIGPGLVVVIIVDDLGNKFLFLDRVHVVDGIFDNVF